MSETMIWPIYLDKDKSLSQGRKISTEYAISEPRIREIEKAAKRLGYTFIVETDKSYPGEWYANSGRIIISSEESKKEILIKLSAQIKTIRECLSHLKKIISFSHLKKIPHVLKKN